MLDLQVRLLTMWQAAGNRLRAVQTGEDRDRGEVTATTAIIVLLVIAAIAAGTVIATAITNNANNVPSP